MQVIFEIFGWTKRCINDSEHFGLVTHINESGIITQLQRLSLSSPMVSTFILNLLLFISYQLVLYKINIELKVLIKTVVILDVLS